MSPSLAVVLITHETREQTLALIASLALDPSFASWEIVLVDNASRDGTSEAVAALYPSIKRIYNSPQRGFAGALNQGVLATTAPVVVTVNPDAVAPVGTLGVLNKVLSSDERIAAVGPLVRFPNGKIQRHGMYHPRPYTAAVVLLGLTRLPFFRREAERYYGRHQPGPPVDVESLTGACLMFRRAAWEDVGPFDERFFLYCEDVDWSLRARHHGWRLVFVPNAEIVHAKAAVSQRRSTFMIRQYYRSLRRYYGKHYAPRAPRPVRAFWYGAVAMQESVALVVNALRRTKGLRY
ncbi:MAG: glycosyltransferase family 2 protein [Chloroflexota bacterium]|nr:glycosyltransferase family 2 protein [Chloroflexota bacterium]